MGTFSYQILTNELNRLNQNKHGGVSSNYVERDFKIKHSSFVVDKRVVSGQLWLKKKNK